MDATTDLFLDAVDRLEEDSFEQASPLPGWTRSFQCRSNPATGLVGAYRC